MLHLPAPSIAVASHFSSISIMNITSNPPNASQVPSTPADPLGGHTVWEVAVIILITGPLSLVTIIGNMLVIIAFRLNSHLRTVNNYFLLSLAVADLILGTISMNLYTTYVIMGRWALGDLACDIWLAIDYVASNASVMNLLVISFDRFFSVTRPLTYRVKRTPRRAAIMISLAWAISFFLWAPAILFWQYIVGERTVEENECSIQFLSEPIITFGTAIAAFYLPVTIMIILYWRIYRETENRARELAGLLGSPGMGRVSQRSRPQQALSSSTKSSSSSSEETQAEECRDSCFSTQQSVPKLLMEEEEEDEVDGASPSRSGRRYLQSKTNGSWNVDDENGSESSSSEEEENEKDEKGAMVVRVPLIPVTDGLGGSKDCCDSGVRDSDTHQSDSQSSLGPAKPSSLKWPKTKKRRNTSVIREKKAARTLSAILLAFILTWTPYNIMVLVSTFCEHCVPERLWQLGYWLCYVNSTVNPMCYALCNKSFRVTFKMLLLCRWDRRKWTKHHMGAPSPLRPHKSSSVV